MKKEDLSVKTVETLRVMATEAKITGRSKMNKAALVEALAAYCASMAPETPAPTETTARIITKPEAPIAPPAPKPALPTPWHELLAQASRIVRENPGREREDLVDALHYAPGVVGQIPELTKAVATALSYERALEAARNRIGNNLLSNNIEQEAANISKSVFCSPAQAKKAIFEVQNENAESKKAKAEDFDDLLKLTRKYITVRIAGNFNPDVKNEVFRATQQVVEEFYGRKRLGNEEFRAFMAAVRNVLKEVRAKLAADREQAAKDKAAREAEEKAKVVAREKSRQERLALIKDRMVFVRPIGSTMNGFPVFTVESKDEAGMIFSDQEKSHGKDRVTVMIGDEYYTVTRDGKGGRLDFAPTSNLEAATRKPAPARNATAATPAPAPAITLPPLQTQMWVTAADRKVGTIRAHVLMGVNGTDANTLFAGLAGKIKVGDYLACVNGKAVSMLYRMDEKALAAIGNGRQATLEEKRAAKAAQCHSGA
ncbi:MAG: hypothetical protein V1867_04470 [Candidatus Falkowbacteria bacterium]